MRFGARGWEVSSLKQKNKKQKTSIKKAKKVKKELSTHVPNAQAANQALMETGLPDAHCSLDKADYATWPDLLGHNFCIPSTPP